MVDSNKGRHHRHVNHPPDYYNTPPSGSPTYINMAPSRPLSGAHTYVEMGPNGRPSNSPTFMSVATSRPLSGTPTYVNMGPTGPTSGYIINPGIHPVLNPNVYNFYVPHMY